MPDIPENIHPVFDRILSRRDKETRLRQRARVVWLYGLSGSGKSTLAAALERRLHADGFTTHLLDGDNVRTGLNRDLGFSDADRGENIRRVAETSRLFVQAGIIVINAFITPTRALRELARGIVGADDFIDVYVEASWETCARRDPKGLYAGAGRGEVRCFVKEVRYKMDINTLHKLEGDLEIGMNDIGRLRLRATAPLFFDGYKRNRTTGSLILIDEFTNNTVAAGMILEPGGAEVAEYAYADMGGL